MFLPRLKNYQKFENTMTLSFPLKVWCGDRPSRNLLAVLHEMMPYGEFVQAERDEATLTIEVYPAMVQGNRPEYYSFYAKDGKMSIMAKDYRGLVNAAATLAQAVRFEDGQFVIDEASINDYPGSTFRGVMLDPARHVVPMDEVRALILGMAKSKYNKLHLHLCDHQGFSYYSDVYPDLPLSPGTTYTKDDLREIVSYSALFGIDVIPEIDLPAHSFNLTKTFANLKCHSVEEENGGEEVLSGWNICIGNEDSYTYIKNILTEVAEIFPYEYIHMGTDEISMDDIQREPRLSSFTCKCRVCNERFLPVGYDTLLPRFYYFVNRVYNIVNDLGKKMMMWNDQIDISNGAPEIPRDILIEFWRVAMPHRGPVEGCSMAAFVEAGFEVVNADYPNTYVDLYMKWDKLKNWNLRKDPADVPHVDFRILGGETCAWEGNNYPHYRHALYFTFPTFGDRCWNVTEPLADDADTMLALTRACLGASVPADFNLFSYLTGVPLGDAYRMEGKIFAEEVDLAPLKATLESLTNLSVDQEHLKDNLLSLIP